MIHLLLTATLAAGTPPVQVAPHAIDLGTVEFGSKTEAAAWLINTTDEPVRVTAARPSCGCVVVEFEPVELGPRQASEVKLAISAPNVIGEPSSRSVRFTVENADPAVLEIAIQSTHPLVERVRRYAGAAGPAADDLLAADARLWIGAREGSGHAIDSSGAWGNWDDFMRFERFRVTADRRVLARAYETSELHKLIGRPELRFAVTFEFDDDDRIQAVTVVPRDQPAAAAAAATVSAAGHRSRP